MSGSESVTRICMHCGWPIEAGPPCKLRSDGKLVHAGCVSEHQEERLGHLLAWIRALPEAVEGPAGMVKLIRCLLADMDALAEVLSETSGDGRHA